MRPVSIRKNALYRGFNRIYGAVERAYTRLIGRMVKRSVLMTLIALTLASAASICIAVLFVPSFFVVSSGQPIQVVLRDELSAPFNQAEWTLWHFLDLTVLEPVMHLR